MPWRLIGFIVILAIILAFVTFNLENECNIYFGFNQFGLKNVPVFLAVFIPFIVGLICAFPLALHFRGKNKKAPAKTSKSKHDAPIIDTYIEPKPDDKIKQEAALAKEKFLANRRGGKK